MSKDIYGVPNRHYGSEPDTERDEAAVTEEAVDLIDHHGKCPSCKVYCPCLGSEPDAHFRSWTRLHALGCTPLRERVVAQREADRE